MGRPETDLARQDAMSQRRAAEAALRACQEELSQATREAAAGGASSGREASSININEADIAGIEPRVKFLDVSSRAQGELLRAAANPFAQRGSTAPPRRVCVFAPEFISTPVPLIAKRWNSYESSGEPLTNAGGSQPTVMLVGVVCITYGVPGCVGTSAVVCSVAPSVPIPCAMLSAWRWRNCMLAC